MCIRDEREDKLNREYEKGKRSYNEHLLMWKILRPIRFGFIAIAYARLSARDQIYRATQVGGAVIKGSPRVQEGILFLRRISTRLVLKSPADTCGRNNDDLPRKQERRGNFKGAPIIRAAPWNAGGVILSDYTPCLNITASVTAIL